MIIDCAISTSNDPMKQIVECLEITKKIDEEAKKCKNLTLNLNEIKWILPCSALILSSKITELFNRKYSMSYIQPSDTNVKNYLSVIGFPLGCQKETETYLPIHHFNGNTNEEVNKVLDIINKKFPKKAEPPIAYILSELADNIEQHSKFSHASIMAQYFKKSEIMDIGVIDNGVTIPSLFEQKSIKFKEDFEAINLAISGRSTKEEDKRGFGLPSSKYLVEEGLKGSFYIVSRRGAMVIEYPKESKFFKLENTTLNGTMVYMRFQAPRKDIDIYKYAELK